LADHTQEVELVASLLEERLVGSIDDVASYEDEMGSEYVIDIIA